MNRLRFSTADGKIHELADTSFLLTHEDGTLIFTKRFFTVFSVFICEGVEGVAKKLGGDLLLEALDREMREAFAQMLRESAMNGSDRSPDSSV